MGRHQRLDSAAPSRSAPEAATTTTSSPPPRIALPAAPRKEALPHRRPTPQRTVDDGTRLKALLGYNPHASRRISPAVIMAAAPVVARIPYTGWRGDRERISLLADLLKADEALHGAVDAARALRPENVDYFLSRRTNRNENSFRTIRSLYYRFGRELHPNSYPEPRIRAPRAKELQPPYRAEEMSRLYDFARSASPALSKRMLTALDVVSGTGAWTPELARLRGCDIQPASTDPDVAVVVLVDRLGVIWEVPVSVTDKSARLLTVAGEAGDDLIFTCSRRNLIHHIQTSLARHHSTLTMNAIRLRHTWLVDLLNRRIPMAAVMQLAGINDSHVLAGLRRWMDTYETTELTSLLREATR